MFGDVQFRVRFSAVDTEAEPGPGGVYFFDYANFTNGGKPAGSQVGGYHAGPQVTPWMQVLDPNEPLSIEFVTLNADNCGVDGEGMRDCKVVDHPYAGVAVASCEYQLFEGEAPMWTPLRFPGHYYDEETDLFENWNRYYDPSIGRHLQPEPLMQNPKAVLSYAMRGIQLNPYAYAANNPVKFTDADGRKVLIGASCSARNPNYDWYLNNLSSSVSSARRASCVNIETLSRLQTVLNSEEDNVWVECGDESGYRTNGEKEWIEYAVASGPFVRIHREGWQPNVAAPVLAHELTHAALHTSMESVCYITQSCTSVSGLMIP